LSGEVEALLPLTPVAFEILLALAGPALHGYAVLQAIRQRTDGDPVQVPVGGATPNLFGLLGVRPVPGRDFVESDAAPTDPNVQPGDPAFVNNSAILSHSLWQQRSGGDPSVVGRIIEVGGAPTEAVGVLPSGFQLLLPSVSNTVAAPALWTAMRIDFENAPRDDVFLQVVGRLGPGIGAAHAQADQLAARLRETYPVKASNGRELSVVPLRAALVAPVRPVLLALMAAVGRVLVITCANVSNLLLVRGSRREREVAIRAAVGGSRWRILRQLPPESGLLAIGGAVLGTLFAWFGTQLLLALRPDHLPRLDQVGLDANILAFAVAAAAVSSLVFGLVPALQGSRIHLALALKDRGPTSDARAQRSLRNGVVVAEVALSTVPLIGAGLMVRSFSELRNVEPGYDPSGVLTLSVPVPFARYPNPAERAEMLEALRARLASAPGVVSASSVFPLPLDDVASNGRWETSGAQGDPTLFRQAEFAMMAPDYFETTGTRLEEGRDLTRAEHADRAGVVVIDRTLADLAYPGESAVGRQILAQVVHSDQAEFFEIVGVVEAQRHTSLVDEGRGTSSPASSTAFWWGGGAAHRPSDLRGRRCALLCHRDVRVCDPGAAGESGRSGAGVARAVRMLRLRGAHLEGARIRFVSATAALVARASSLANRAVARPPGSKGWKGGLPDNGFGKGPTQ
jgi:putative ABC transport system permease protein